MTHVPPQMSRGGDGKRQFSIPQVRIHTVIEAIRVPTNVFSC